MLSSECVQKAIDGTHLTKKLRAETLQLGLEFENFKPKTHLFDERFVFQGDH
jgi:hypothetical protein